MSFTVKSEFIDQVAKLTLLGSLDSSTAPAFHQEVIKIIPQNPRELVMDAEHLDFMSSAGLRVIIFAKQKLGPSVKLYLLKPQEQLVETLRMTGLIFSLTIIDQYPE